ncbi:hypothetical protein OQ968_23830 [Mycobacterium sp. 663a-19]|uniref:hypothetical protein n=1 Tax=Mycobacterium sp. 663a-19 TaxID=2986148 RepID=UPI002D1F1472|nr:hypothetical protein [Mycobacterium sp. 663a-19]MEB3984280.1 hypothetical protein [Mycobacterium sp. 663a-19]
MPDEDRDTHPRTEAFVPDFSDSDDDTGAQPIAQSDTEEPGPPAEEPSAPEEGAEPEAPATPAPPVTVPGRYQYLKWWKLVLVILGVWVVTGEVGLSLFYWWYHTIDKTLPVFMVLVYVVACVVGGVLLAMVQGRPLISALSIAVMSGPFASVAAAAPLYGYYYCERVGHCLIGVIPY